jgi:hypothetical protein
MPDTLIPPPLTTEKAMPEVPRSEVCLCGGSLWHAMVDRVLWCRRCGALRLVFEKYWMIPLDRAGELSSTVVMVDGGDEPTTSPGTPDAKKLLDDED